MGEQTPQMQPFRKAKTALLFDQIYRIKRFLMLYHTSKCERIEDQYWHYGGALNHTQKDHLTEYEKTYFANYKALVIDYVEDIDIDLNIDLDPPFESEV